MQLFVSARPETLIAQYVFQTKAIDSKIRTHPLLSEYAMNIFFNLCCYVIDFSDNLK